MSVGVFGIGLAAYWPQFDGLKERVEGYQRRVEERVAELGGDVVSAGLVDSEQAGREAGDRFAAAQVDLVICHAVTYATSSTVLPVAQAAKAPVLLLGLQPTTSLDYANTGTGEWLANCAACCVPELAGAFTRARHPLRHRRRARSTTTSARGRRSAPGCAPRAWRARCGARASASSATCIRACSTCTPTSRWSMRRSARTSRCWRSTTSARGWPRPTTPRSRRRSAEIREMFAFADPSDDPIAGPIEDEALDWSARVAVGLDALVEDFELDALTYYYRGVGDNEAERLGAGLIVGNSLLTARGVPTAGEADLKTNLAQLILDRLGAGGSYTEYYALDFDEDFVLMGHDGPGHVAIAQEQPTLRALKLYHGKSGRRAERRVQGPLRAGDDRRLHPDRGRAAEAAGRRGRVDPRRDVPDRQHQQPPALRRTGPPSSSSAGASRARPTTSRSASATSRATCAPSRAMLDLEYAEVG